MAQLKFTKDHEWVRLEGGVATVGITDHAQTALGDVVFVDLPEAGRVVEPGDACAVVESVKAASDVYAPIAGTILESNEALAADPALVNSAPTAEGWFFKMTPADTAAIDALMDEADYLAFVDSQS
ncbi:glycine cleavage system protein GcvH [Pseudoroseomonas cervicalis]|uniref:Glycine cleavage system H protein n=1 Tax=Pseudoroseomonas cervicalis ATCC 49957 TaxID=525371 RepID=D5RSU7_9PROT|nr:glycine cleavage system protein GcvH [Pseudoroseomonas cervicalis]EFH09621.1 glycine cleavage system H protein [Pseudoroseomonas cervicalis ATCC 49957]